MALIFNLTAYLIPRIVGCVNKKPQDRFALLRVKYMGEIDEHNGIVAELRRKMKALDELEEDAAGLEPEVTPNPALTARGLTQVVLDTIVLIGETSGVQASAVAKTMLANGFTAKGKNFKISVINALNRLTEQGYLKSQMTEGKRLYMKK